VDAERFDALLRTLVTPTARRTVMATLSAVAFGSILSPPATARRSGACVPPCGECEHCATGACKRKHHKKRCRAGTCQLLPAGTPCTAFPSGICRDGVCLNLRTDEANCGAIGTACAANHACQEGRCFPISVCPATTTSLCPASASTGVHCAMTGVCDCGQTAEGNVVCVQLPPICGGPTTPCTRSADCAAGEACVDASDCCGVLAIFPPGSKICLPPCPAPL